LDNRLSCPEPVLSHAVGVAPPINHPEALDVANAVICQSYPDATRTERLKTGADLF
jgi:hypothetical protein